MIINHIGYQLVIFFFFSSSCFTEVHSIPGPPVSLAPRRGILFRGGRVWREPSHPPTPGRRPVSAPALPELLPPSTAAGPPQTQLPLPGATAEPNTPTPTATRQTRPPRTVRTGVRERGCRKKKQIWRNMSTDGFFLCYIYIYIYIYKNLTTWSNEQTHNYFMGWWFRMNLYNVAVFVRKHRGF